MTDGVHHAALLLLSLVVSGPALGDADEVGIFRSGLWYLDTNGNNEAGGDLAFGFGLPTDTQVWGDWDGDGHDQVGIFRDGLWYLDTDSNNQADGDVFFVFGQAGDVPVVGDFAGSGFDQVGIFRNGLWFLDTNANHVADAGDTIYNFGSPTDVPVVYGCAACGQDLIGIFRDGLWFLDSNPNGQSDAGDFFTYFGQAGDVPVVGDWLGVEIGQDQIGIFRDGMWYLDTDFDFHAGGDLAFVFGQAGDMPVVGAWGGCGDPTSGDCGAPNGTPGCAADNCCAAVCAVDPLCCDVEWDSTCAGAGSQFCGAQGAPDVTGYYGGFGTGSSFSVTADCGMNDPPTLLFDFLIVNVTAQDGVFFEGLYYAEISTPESYRWEDGQFTGAVDDTGQVIGSGVYQDYVDFEFNSSGEFSFTGVLSGDTLTFDTEWYDTATSGDACAGTATGSASR